MNFHAKVKAVGKQAKLNFTKNKIKEQACERAVLQLQASHDKK